MIKHKNYKNFSKTTLYIKKKKKGGRRPKTPPNYIERTPRTPLHSSSTRDPTPKNTPQISSPAFLLVTHKTTLNTSVENHYQKDLKPPSPSSPPCQKDSKPPPPSSQPFDRTSATGYPVIDPPIAPPPLHIQSQPQVPWSTGLCDCCQDVGSCCLTCWCPCITFGRIVDIVDRGSTSCGASGTCYTLLWLVFGTPSLYSCFYRTKSRAQFHLHGNQCTYCPVHCCCETCAVCQEYRELKNRGFDMEIGWHTNVERQTPGITSLPPSVTGGMSR